MKIRFACLVLIGTLGIPLVAERNDGCVYFLGGLTIFPEGTSIEIASKEGYGNRWGMGFQFNSFFGLEIARDSAPAIEDASIVKIFERDLESTVTNYEIKSSYNRFSSLVSTFSVPVSKYTKIIGKAGYANYSYQSKVMFTSNSGIQFDGKLEEDYGLTPTASLGVRFPLWRGSGPRVGIEFAMSKVFEEEVESTWSTMSFFFRF